METTALGTKQLKVGMVIVDAFSGTYHAVEHVEHSVWTTNLSTQSLDEADDYREYLNAPNHLRYTVLAKCPECGVRYDDEHQPDCEIGYDEVRFLKHVAAQQVSK